MLGELVRRHARQLHASDVQVDSGTLRFGNQRIGRLLDPVVQELAGAVGAHDQIFAHRLGKALLNLGLAKALPRWDLRRPADQREIAQVKCVAQASSQLQRFLR